MLPMPGRLAGDIGLPLPPHVSQGRAGRLIKACQPDTAQQAEAGAQPSLPQVTDQLLSPVRGVPHWKEVLFGIQKGQALPFSHLKNYTRMDGGLELADANDYT